MTFRPCHCEKPGCPVCGPMVALAEELRLEFDATRRQAHVPAPEIVWWRAQMRARQEAARAATRPILFAQALAVAALLGLLVSVAGRLTLPSLSSSAFAAAWANIPVLPLAAAAALCVIVAPFALYLALSRR